MEPIINEHGVIINHEITKIVDCKEGYIEIRHIEHAGKVYATLSIWAHEMGMISPLGLDDEVESFEVFVKNKADNIRRYLSDKGEKNMIILREFEKYCYTLKQPALF